jgi:hypothetical protein
MTASYATTRHSLHRLAEVALVGQHRASLDGIT